MIRCDGVEFSYPGRPPALDGVDLRLPPAGRVELCGTSGSGKSTLALCLAALLEPSAGRVEIDGLPAGDDRRAIAWRVGHLFQHPASQLLTRCVADEIALPLENLGWARGDIRRRVAAVLDGLELAPLAARDPQHLSGGEMQRVALAAALAPGPRYLFLDEPFAHLDPATAAAVETWLDRSGVGEACLRLDIRPLPGETSERVHVLEAGRLIHDGDRDGPLPAALRERLTGADAIDAPPAWNWTPRPAGVGVRAADLAVGFDGAALAGGIDLELGPGTVTALTGPTGSGKSTVLMTLAGLLDPVEGGVSIDGRAASGGELRRVVTYVPQFPERMFWRRTVAAELESCAPSRDPATDPRAELERVGLAPALADVSPFRLSGGERRRLALAAALVCGRPVVLLDEPGAGLDGPGMEVLRRTIAGMAAAGATVLLVAHDRRLVGWASRVLELRDGHLRDVPPAD